MKNKINIILVMFINILFAIFFAYIIENIISTIVESYKKSIMYNVDCPNYLEECIANNDDCIPCISKNDIIDM